MKHPYDWFELLDRCRRLQGHGFDRLGLGPIESDYRVVYESEGLRLRDYGVASGTGPPLLIVPAPIKRPYIWDLAPECSVVRHALAHRLRVYLVEWREPDAMARPPSLADYAGAMLSDCVDVIGERTGKGQVALAGHSLGGIFAALHGAYRPEHVAGLVIVDAPLHFTGAEHAFHGPAEVTSGLEGKPSIPGSLLSASSARAAPATFCTSRYLDLLASLPSTERRTTHWRVERWTLDEMPMSPTLFHELSDLRRHNRFMRGQLTLDGVMLSPQRIRAPLWSIYQATRGMIPAESILAFHAAVGSKRKQLAAYPGDVGVALQHVGPLVGSNAHRIIWPAVFQWLQALPKAD
jgi:polyhydroxyalkanoate synthase subunit PhaC